MSEADSLVHIKTLATFAIFYLAGLQFSPRIRDIGRPQLYRLTSAATWQPDSLRC